MKHPKVPDPSDPDGREIDDRSRIIYDEWITIEGIPERAYAYELGSRSAIGWVMETNRVRTDKASGIRNYPKRAEPRAERLFQWPDGYGE
jgi:predicted helicase